MPLIDAVSRGNLADVCACLQEDSVDVNARDDLGRTPLLIAVMSGYTAIVEALLGNEQVDLTAVCTDRQYNALMFAVEGDELEIATLLCAKGADVNAAPPEGQSPLVMAAAKDDLSIFAVLYPHTKNSAQCDHANLIAAGLTALRFADPMGWEEVDAVETVFADEGVTRNELTAFVDACDEQERTAHIALFAKVYTMIQDHNDEIEKDDTTSLWASLWAGDLWEATTLQSAHTHYAPHQPAAAAAAPGGPK